MSSPLHMSTPMFDRYLQTPAGSWPRRWLAIVSIGGHAVAIGVVMYLTLVRPKVEPAAIPVTYVAHRAGPASAKASAPKAAPTSNRKRAQPNTLKLKRPVVNAPRPEAESPENTTANASTGPAAGNGNGAAGPAGGAATKTVPQFVFDRERLTFPDPHLPDWFKEQHPRQTVSGLYRICVGVSGKVIDVQVVNGIPGVDAMMVNHLRNTWQYKPQPVPVCSPRLFKFQVN